MITDDHPNAEELRKEGRELYLKDIDEDDKVAVAEAFVKVRRTPGHQQASQKTGHTLRAEETAAFDCF